MNLQVFEIP